MAQQHPFFTVRDIARMWTEERARKAGIPVERAKPVATATVLSCLKHSKPNRPGRRPHRYADNPMPMPVYVNEDEDMAAAVQRFGLDRRGRQPIWLPEPGETLAGLEGRLRAWPHSRVGAGVGGGRPRKQRPDRASCPCGCGEMVASGTRCDRSATEQARTTTSRPRSRRKQGNP